MMAMLGIGALGGAVALAALGRERPPVAALATPALLQAAGTAALAAVHTERVVVRCSADGIRGILFMAGSNSTVQLTVPDELTGTGDEPAHPDVRGVTPFGAFLMGSVRRRRA